MGRENRFSPEVKERAVRLVYEQQKETDSQWAAIRSVASKISCSAETLRNWIRKEVIDTGSELLLYPSGSYNPGSCAPTTARTIYAFFVTMVFGGCFFDSIISLRSSSFISVW